VGTEGYPVKPADKLLICFDQFEFAVRGNIVVWYSINCEAGPEYVRDRVRVRETILIQHGFDFGGLRDMYCEPPIWESFPHIQTSQEPSDWSHKLNCYFLAQACFKRLLCSVGGAEIREIVHIESDEDGGFAVNQSAGINARVIQERTQSQFLKRVCNVYKPVMGTALEAINSLLKQP